MDRIWTEEDRQRQATVARKHRIWEKSTGPKTQEGKERIRENAVKHGMRSKTAIRLQETLHLQDKALEKVADAIIL